MLANARLRETSLDGLAVTLVRFWICPVALARSAAAFASFRPIQTMTYGVDSLFPHLGIGSAAPDTLTPPLGHFWILPILTRVFTDSLLVV
jgi:hypothetical protein